MRDPSSRRSRGFGFVTYVEAESVEALMADGPQQTLQGRTVEVKRALPRATPSPGAQPSAGSSTKATRGKQSANAQGSATGSGRHSRRAQRGAVRERANGGRASKGSGGRARAPGHARAPAPSAAPHVNVWEVKAKQAAAAANAARPPTTAGEPALSAAAGRAQLAQPAPTSVSGAATGAGIDGRNGSSTPREDKVDSTVGAATSQSRGIAGRKIFVGGLHYNTDDGTVAHVLRSRDVAYDHTCNRVVWAGGGRTARSYCRATEGVLQ